MSKETKIKIVIVIGYFISLFLFELVNNILNYNKYMEFVESIDVHVLAVIFIPSIEAGICHFICVSIMAIIGKFFLKISKEYKKIIYFFPVLTFIFTIPMSLPVMYVHNVIGL